MLADASNVRKVGTETLNGVPVTEYSGTVSLDKRLQYLSGSFKRTFRGLMSSSSSGLG
jgi:hypothetical protein